MDLSDIIENLEDIDNLDRGDKLDLSDKLYDLAMELKAEEKGIPKLLAEGENIQSYKDKINNEIEELKELNTNYNNIINDIYHIYGLAKLDSIEIMKIASMFKDKMKKRFKYKDKYKVLKIIKRQINKDKEFFRNLQGAIDKSKQKINEFDTRGYIPRTDFGKMLVDEFSKDDDDLRKGVTREQIDRLKNNIETKVS